MKNQIRQHVLDECVFLGDAVLENYGLYEIGRYPAAVPMDGFRVYGEVYEVDEKIKKQLDEIEDVGNLYNYKTVEVRIDNEYISAGFYEFIEDGNTYPVRKPVGKWNTIRNDL